MAFVPFVVVVRVFPSSETTMVCVTVALPPCLAAICVVLASTRVSATVSPYGLLPVTGLSLPS